jgi:hypothetical protein
MTLAKDGLNNERLLLDKIAELESQLALVKAQRDALADAFYWQMARPLDQMRVNEDQYKALIESHIQAIIDNAKP